MKKILYYIHDPMCAWCYGFDKTFDALKQSLQQELENGEFEIIYIAGGLAPHTNEPMPQIMRETIENYWYEIERVTGTTFNHDFWTKCSPRRSTYLACQATIAARLQDREEDMVKAIQNAYYQRAMNPSDASTLITIADELNLDVKRFEKDLVSQETIEIFEQDLNLRRKLGVNSFPTLLLKYKKECYPISITYNEPEKILAQIKNLSENIYF